MAITAPHRLAGPGRPLAAAFLSSVFPGLGQLFAGRRRRGVVMLEVGVALAALGLALWFSGDVLRLLVQPRVLIWLLIADATVLAFRVFAVVDAYRLGTNGFRVPRWGAAGLAALLLATAAPHAVAAYYDLEAYGLLTDVFEEEAAQALPAPVGEEPPPFVPPPPPEPVWERQRINVLLIGGDAATGRPGLRADTLMVASVEPATGRAVLFGIPRNFAEVPLPDGSSFDQPINSLYGYANARPWMFPGGEYPGATALMGAAGELLGIRVDFHALVDFAGFVGIVDALGGVTVSLRYGLSGTFSQPDGSYEEVYIPSGEQHLNGRLALAFARARKSSSDYERMRRQRCLLGSLARETDLGDVLLHFPRIARAIRQFVQTDIPLQLLPDLVELAEDVRTHRITAIGLTYPDFAAGRNERGYPTPNLDLIHRTVHRTFTTPTRDLPDLGFDDLETAC